MLPQWIIEKKRDGQALTHEELAFFLNGYTRGDIPDYQMSALAMAVYFQGMTPAETAALTRVMLDSGDQLDTSSIVPPKVDKHSTGGVGDMISIPLAPLAACGGVAVPMISGRGLGITGGTLDKLDSIPGYRTNLSVPEFLAVIRDCDCSIIGQTERLAPADRKLYALRDVTGTVPSIPLIVASIMSKKLAEGLDALVLDVKCGRGAFMRTPGQARALAQALADVGRSMGKRVSTLITAMDQPLGRAAGNALEIAQAVDVLRGRGPEDVTRLTLRLGAEMLTLTGAAPDTAAATARLDAALKSGAAFERFKQMVRLHGGNVSAIEDTSRLPAARHREPLPASSDGIVQDVDAEKIGRAALLLGAGRSKTTDVIDPAAGLSDMARAGDRVRKGQPLAVLHAADPQRIESARALAQSAFVIGTKSVPPLLDPFME